MGVWPTAGSTTRAAVRQPLPGRSAVAGTTPAWAASYRGLALAGVRPARAISGAVIGDPDMTAADGDPPRLTGVADRATRPISRHCAPRLSRRPITRREVTTRGNAPASRTAELPPRSWMAIGRESSALRSGPGSGSTPWTRLPERSLRLVPWAQPARRPRLSGLRKQLAKPGKIASCRGILGQCQKEWPLAEIAELPGRSRPAAGRTSSAWRSMPGRRRTNWPRMTGRRSRAGSLTRTRPAIATERAPAPDRERLVGHVHDRAGQGLRPVEHGEDRRGDVQHDRCSRAACQVVAGRVRQSADLGRYRCQG